MDWSKPKKSKNQIESVEIVQCIILKFCTIYDALLHNRSRGSGDAPVVDSNMKKNLSLSLSQLYMSQMSTLYKDLRYYHLKYKSL
jgi:hypothetical protein